MDAILEAAARILEAQGLAGYNTNDVARVAGISIGSLYQYFPNKEAITGALIRREMTALLAAADGVEMRADPLTALIRVAVDHQLGRSALARLLDLEEQRLPMDAELADIRSRLTVIVKRCMDRETGVHDDVAVQDVIAIIRGLVDAAGHRGETDAEALAERVSRAVLSYLR